MPERTAGGQSIGRRIAKVFGPVLVIALFSAALWVLHRELRQYHYREIMAQVHAVSGKRVALAIVLTALGYAVLTLYDYLAIRYIRRPLPYHRIALASFIGYAFSHTIGLAFLSGGSVRYRLYSAWGLSAVQVTAIVLFGGLTFILGFLAAAGAIFLLWPMPLPASLYLHLLPLRVLGAVFLALVAGYVLLCGLRKEPLRIGSWDLRPPSLRMALAQVIVAIVDWSFAAGVLFVLLPRHAAPFTMVMGVFLLGQVAGVLSHVPGGLGVFETIVLVFLSPALAGHEVLGALILYRLIYYLLPLAGATVLMGAREVMEHREHLRWAAQFLGRWGPSAVPDVLALSTFISGVILLVSGATPAQRARLHWLKDVLPLPFLELSHFLGSVAGVLLLVVARGLQRRLDAAYHVTAALLAGGIVFSLVKGLDYEEAIALTVSLAALLASQRHFYRRSSLMSERFTWPWITAIVLALLASMWLGFFTHRHAEYSENLWWRFAFSADASRTLRAMAGAMAVVVFFALGRLMRAAPPEPNPPGPAQLARAAELAAQSPRTSAYLALLGDKRLLFSDSQRAFIAYGVEARSWVAMGDPVGEESEFAELAWDFRELVDRHDGWPVFYLVQSALRELYLDLELSLIKVGEEARVRLAEFSLEGGARKSLRQACARVERQGYRFEVLAREDVPPLLGEMREISDAWLARKETREKGFSMGFFSEDYLRNFPAAVIRQDGRIVAFANVWASAARVECSVDLMRYRPDSPHGIMDCLLVNVMTWATQQGYEWFNLGMAPLSGLAEKSSLWLRMGSLVFRHGEHFYHFQGLREYKEKFGPVWEPRYLASPPGLAVPVILANIATLTSGGIRGVVSR